MPTMMSRFNSWLRRITLTGTDFPGGTEAIAFSVAVELATAFCLHYRFSFAVVLKRQSGLPQLVKTYREIKEIVRVLRFNSECLKVGLLRFGPASLASVKIA